MTAQKTNVGKKTNKIDVKRWTDIEGLMTVFANKVEYGKGKDKKSFIQYYTTVSTQVDGEYANKSVKVAFKKDVDPKLTDGDILKINVVNGFLTLETWFTDDGEIRKNIKVVVTEYDEVE